MRWFAREIDRARLRTLDRSLHLQLRRKAEERLELLLRCEPKPGRLVFPSFRTTHEADHGPLPFDNVRKALARAVKDAGIGRKVGLHTLRHTFAVSLARANVPLTKISSALGHGSLKTTQIYLRFYPDEGADVTSRIPSLGAPPSEPELLAQSTVKHAEASEARPAENPGLCVERSGHCSISAAWPENRSDRSESGRLSCIDPIQLVVVELRGVEPLTPRLPAWCSTN